MALLGKGTGAEVSWAARPRRHSLQATLGEVGVTGLEHSSWDKYGSTVAALGEVRWRHRDAAQQLPARAALAARCTALPCQGRDNAAPAAMLCKTPGQPSTFGAPRPSLGSPTHPAKPARPPIHLPTRAPAIAASAPVIV